MANERRIKGYYLPTHNYYSRSVTLKFHFFHDNGRCRFGFPKEMGMIGWEAEMVTEAWVLAQREKHKKGLHYLYMPLYLKLLKYMAATEAGRFWAPYSGLRDVEEQLKLYNKGRTAESKALGEKIITNAIPGDSAHNWGCASDWAEFCPEFKGSEAWERANWEFFQKAVNACNMDWGGDWDRDGLSEPNEFDYPHSQLALRCPWRKVGDIYRIEGEIKAMEFIQIQALTGEEGERI